MDKTLSCFTCKLPKIFPSFDKQTLLTNPLLTSNMASLTAYQGHRKKSQASAGKIISIFKQTKNRQTAFQSVENTTKRGFQCHTLPDFIEALPNFGLFLKLGAPNSFGPGASCPCHTPSSQQPCGSHNMPTTSKNKQKS